MHSGHFKTIIEGPAVNKLLRKLVSILEYETGDLALEVAWDVLTLLSDHLVNTAAFKLMSGIMADNELCSRIHSSAAKHILLAEDKAYHTVAGKCLGYLTYFSSGDGPRHMAVGHTPDLIKHLLAASVSINILGRCLLEDPHNAVVFFNVDGFTVVRTA
jgi:hypothetical protein